LSPPESRRGRRRSAPVWSRRTSTTVRSSSRTAKQWRGLAANSLEGSRAASVKREGAMRLSDEQVRRYRDEGYLILEAIIPVEKLGRYRAIFDELVERSRALTESQGGFNLAPDEQGRPIPGRLHKIQGVGVVDDRVLELAREPEILDRVESLLGPNLDVF